MCFTVGRGLFKNNMETLVWRQIILTFRRRDVDVVLVFTRLCFLLKVQWRDSMKKRRIWHQSQNYATQAVYANYTPI